MNVSDLKRNAYMLRGSLAKKGYMRWWHSFAGIRPDTGETRTFFIEYLILNPGLGSAQPILGQHPYFKKRKIKSSYVRIKAGVFPDAGGSPGLQLHSYHGISTLKASSGAPLVLQAEDCFYSEDRISGYVDVSVQEARHRSLMTDAGCMEWDLEIQKAVACHTGSIASPFSCALSALTSFWHGEGIRSFYRGSVLLNGISYEVTPESCYGYADKHWGSNYNHPWLQLASCHLTSKRTGKVLRHSALAVNGCCPKLFLFPLKKKLMLQLTYMGEDFEFNFARPFLLSRCRWRVKETNKRFIWQISAQNRNAVAKITINSPKDTLMPLMYETPDGHPLKPAPQEGALGMGTLELYRRTRAGRELVDTLQIEDVLCGYQP